MNINEIQSKNIQVGDRIYLQYTNNVVRSGIFLGIHPLPWFPLQMGLCITYDTHRNIVDWIEISYIKQMEITIPTAVIESVKESFEQGVAYNKEKT